MTANEPVQGGPYPEPTDPPDGPNQLAALAAWAAGRLVMRFATTAARDAALPSPVEGQTAVTGSGDTLQKWIYQDGEWRLEWQPPRSQTVATTVGSGTIEATLSTDARHVDVVVNGSSMGLVSGELVSIGYIPEGFRPPSTRGAAGYISGHALAVLIGTDGRIQVRHNSGGGGSLGALYAAFGYPVAAP